MKIIRMVGRMLCYGYNVRLNHVSQDVNEEPKPVPMEDDGTRYGLSRKPDYLYYNKINFQHSECHLVNIYRSCH